MGNKCFSCQLCCAASKIICYQFCCCCLHEKKTPKTNISVLMVGLKGVGKSHLLSLLCNETTEIIQPTNGFSMKDILLEMSILHVKELGGSEKIQPYWTHYMDNSQGVIYVLDGTKINDNEILEKNRDVLERVLEDDKMQNVPLLVTVTRLESHDELHDILRQNIVDKLELNSLSERKFMVAFVKDMSQFKNVLEEFSSAITGGSIS